MSDHEEKISIKIPKKSGFSHILFNIAAAGYTHIVITYSGSGDDGSIESVRGYKKGFVEENGDEDDLQMELIADDGGVGFEETLNERIEEYIYSNLLDT